MKDVYSDNLHHTICISFIMENVTYFQPKNLHVCKTTNLSIEYQRIDLIHTLSRHCNRPSVEKLLNCFRSSARLETAFEGNYTKMKSRIVKEYQSLCFLFSYMYELCIKILQVVCALYKNKNSKQSFSCNMLDVITGSCSYSE
jgi:hypothetical protein